MHGQPTRRRPASWHRREAFTLIELLVVIGIILILMALAVAVGTAVIGSSKATQTRNTIRVLDTALNDLMQSTGKLPPAYVHDPRDDDSLMPLADARNMTQSDNLMVNSTALLLHHFEDDGVELGAIESIDTKLFVRYTPYDTSTASNADVVPELPTVLDAWGNPIRFVHPVFHGTYFGPDPLDPTDPTSPVDITASAFFEMPAGSTLAFSSLRRNAEDTSTGGNNPQAPDEFADSDGGLCPNQKPYFYSMGQDERVGSGRLSKDRTVPIDFNEDNVYTITPKFPAKN